MHWLILFLSVVAATKVCDHIKNCSDCVRQSGCVFGVDFKNYGGCLNEDDAEDMLLSKLVHSSSRCVQVGELIFCVRENTFQEYDFVSL